MAMRIADRKQVKFTVGVIGAGVLLYGIYKLYRHLRPSVQGLASLNVSFDANEEDEKETFSFMNQANQRNPYDILIEDALRDKLGAGSLSDNPHLKDIRYRIILSLMKGNSYQGIVNISFFLEQLAEGEDHLKVNFRGSGIKYLMVNGKVLQAKDIQFLHHQILIPRELVQEQSNNQIEVIFQNFYSFLNEGLSTYFMVDQHQKYSLRQQVIYSVSGGLSIEKIIPCFNCLNECRIQIEVIHSDSFEVFSNTSKSLARLCSAAQYQKYPFLFDLTSSTLNKSFKLTESTISSYSGLESSINLSYSSAHYHNRKKANSHFYKERLPCIHHMFILSSPLIELQPTAPNSPLETEVLLRYFCKHAESHRLVKGVDKIHTYILDVCRRLHSKDIKNHINKLDILIIADREVEGYFAPGVLLLCEDTLRDSSLSIRCLYLISRALVGLLQLKRGRKGVTLADTLELNYTVFEQFEQFRNYLFIKNQKFARIAALINSEQGKTFIEEREGYFLQYFSKELRFLITRPMVSKVSFELEDLLACRPEESQEEFWENFLANHSSLSPLIIEPLLKLALRQVPLPSNPRLLDQLKACFSNSKYLLNFYSNQEISDELPKFMELEVYNLQQRLTEVKVKQKFKESITERYEMYLPIRSNIAEAEAMYLQFKHFNERKNFHHFSVLKSEINRISYFGKQFVAFERMPFSCSIMAWKLLTRLQLYPKDEEHYQLIRVFEGSELCPN